MREYFQQNPIVFGFLFFCFTTVTAIFAGISLGFYIVNQPCQPQGPGDPCDGPAMLFVSLLFVSPVIGLMFGIIAGLAGWFYMRLGKSFHRQILTIK